MNYFDSSSGDHEEIFKLLSTTRQSGHWQVSKNMKATSTLRDFTLDITEATFEHPVVHINILRILTSDTFCVPEGIRVVCNVSCILGSVKIRCLAMLMNQLQPL